MPYIGWLTKCLGLTYLQRQPGLESPNQSMDQTSPDTSQVCMTRVYSTRSEHQLVTAELRFKLAEAMVLPRFACLKENKTPAHFECIGLMSRVKGMRVKDIH